MRGIWTDYRIAERPRRVFCDLRDLMQIPEALRKCVFFIRVGFGDGSGGTATGFLLSEPVDYGTEERFFIYAVTARHNLHHPDTGVLAEKVEIRLNRVDGGSEWIPVDPKLWVPHLTADVVVMGWMPAPSRDEFDYLHYPAAGDLDQEQIDQFQIGPGHEVFITGLLTYHQGVNRLLPIIRTGIIAAFPEEPLKLKTGAEDSILIEVRSIGGLSGSPAFVHFPDWWRDSEGQLQKLSVRPGEKWTDYLSGPNVFLGLVHGVYNTSGDDRPDWIDVTGLNTGISVVVPASKINEVINGSPFAEVREEVKKMIEAKNMPTPTSGQEPGEFQRFEELAKRIVTAPKKAAKKPAKKTRKR